jgi:hypothetical protein
VAAMEAREDAIHLGYTILKEFSFVEDSKEDMN